MFVGSSFEQVAGAHADKGVGCQVRIPMTYMLVSCNCAIYLLSLSHTCIQGIDLMIIVILFWFL